MKGRLFIWVFPLFMSSCSYGANPSDPGQQFTSNLTEQQRTCIEDRLLTGWDLKLADLRSDLSPDEEIAVDMVTELCQLNPSDQPNPTPTDYDKPQVSEELLQAPSFYDSTDPPPGENPLLDRYWSECGLGDAKACDNLFYSAPRGSEYEQFAFSCGGRRNMDCSLLLGIDQPNGDLSPLTPPPGEDQELDKLWVKCSEGSTLSCGELRLTATSGSLYSQFGTSCGARGTTYCTLILEYDGEPPSLNDLNPGMDPPGDDELLDRLWQLCGNQDARSCKDLSKYGPADSIYVKFGISCGGRSVAPCARLFADGKFREPLISD